MRLKVIALSLLSICVTSQNIAQEWKKKLSNGAPYKDVVETFEKEWGNKPYEKHQGFKPYYRYKTFWQSRLNSKGEIPSKRAIYQSQQAYMDMYAQTITGNEDHGNWRSEGPFNHTNTTSWSPGQGRVNVVIEDPNDINTIYVGAPDGGLWKSENAGTTWESLIDDFSRLGVSDIVIDYNNSETIYIATGDADGNDAMAIGVWKTTDGGETWTETGSILANKIYKIEMDPDDSNRLLAATNDGLYLTTNAGSTWTLVHYQTCLDVQFAKGVGNTKAFAVTESSFIRSTDDGADWTQITNGIPNDFAYMRLDVTEDDSNYVYVVGAGVNGNFSGEYRGIYKSTDGGASFAEIHNVTDEDIFNNSGQAWYDLDIAVDENNKNNLVVGVINIWKSTDGGSNWNQLNYWSSPHLPSYTHADIHFLKWHGDHLYCGSDGGVYKSTDNGDTFTDLTKGLPIGQFYDIDVYKNDPSYIAGGLQDNGGYYFDGFWKNYYGADGMTALFNQSDSSTAYGMIQNGSLNSTQNFGMSNNGLGSPSGISGNWVTPMEWDEENNRAVVGYNKLYTRSTTEPWNELSSYTFPSNLSHIELFNNRTSSMLVSTHFNGVFYTSDSGLTWTNVITNLPTSNGFIEDIEFDDSDSSHFFIVQSSSIYETTDAGTTWTNIVGSLPATFYNDIEMDHAQVDKSLYLATDVGVHYYNTTLGDWIPFNANLPNVVVSDIEILSNFNAIRIGTYGRGIYASNLYDQNIHLNDIQLLSSDIGIDTLCSPDLYPIRFEVKNRAWDTINAFHYEILINNTPELSTTLNTEIFPFQNLLVSSSPVMFNTGINDLTIILSSPNGNTDSAPYNDTLRTTVFVESGIDLHTIELEINLDGYPSETSWSLVADDGTIIESVSPSDYAGLNNEHIIKNYCLDDGCYTFTIEDDYGDFNGSYKLTDFASGEIFEHFGDFGPSSSHDFCLPNASPGPSANFQVSNTEICSNTTVQFSDNSLNNPSTWMWTFENGIPNTSSSQNPLVTYTTSGLHDVQLIVSNGIGTDTILSQEYIEVSPEITYTLNSTPNPITSCTDSVIIYLSNYDVTHSVEWKNENGLSFGNNDSIIVYNSGEYYVKLTNTNGCHISDTVSIDLESTIIALFTPSAEFEYLDDAPTFTFNNQSTTGLSYAWDFGDGNSSSDFSPTHTYTAVGNYSVTLTVTNSECSKAYVFIVSVYPHIGLSEHDILVMDVLPNPNQGIFSLDIKQNINNGEIQIFDALGRQLYIQEVVKGINKIAIPNIGKGTYLLHLIEDGGNLATKKVIIE